MDSNPPILNATELQFYIPGSLQKRVGLPWEIEW